MTRQVTDWHSWSAWLPAAGYALLVLILSLFPAPPEIKVPVLGWDKLQHALAYAVLTLLIARALGQIGCNGKRKWLLAVLVAAAWGGLLEIAQGLFTTCRNADWGDVLADAIGAGGAWLVSEMYRWRRGAAIILVATQLAGGIATTTVTADTTQPSLTRIGDEAWELVSTPLADRQAFFGTTLALGLVGVGWALDEEIRDQLGGRSSQGLRRAADWGAALGDPLLHLAAATALFGYGAAADDSGARQLAVMIGEALVLADGSTLLLKAATGRGRPDQVAENDRFHPFSFSDGYDSLPSLHTASSFAVASVLAATSEGFWTKLGVYTAATFVGFSRIVQNHHWTSDVLLGALLGEVSGRVVTANHARQGKRLVLAPQPLPGGLLLAVRGRW